MSNPHATDGHDGVKRPGIVTSQEPSPRPIFQIARAILHYRVEAVKTRSASAGGGLGRVRELSGQVQGPAIPRCGGRSAVWSLN
jgi:hypothetical protein